MTLRVVELFSGIGAQRMALMQAGIDHEVVAISEINKHSLASYETIYGDCPNLGDISKVEKLPPCDLVTYSFPCFVGGTPVRTPRGDIPIKDIRRGDLVSTDDGWHRVLAQAMTGIHPVVTVTLADGRSVGCTPDHRIMAWAQGFVRPEWMPARMLTREHLCKVWIDGLGWSWMPVVSVSEPGDPVEVYDIEVESAHCFLAKGILAHNCQDLSLAGKRAGMGEGTRSGLVWEVVRLLESAEHRPEWLLMENVPQVLASPLWGDLVGRLEAMGYRNRWAKLDSSRFGSAQKRVRAFMVSRLGRDPPDLPLSAPNAPMLCLRDVMEPERAERYVRRIPLDRVRWRTPKAEPGESTPTASIDGETFYSKAMLYSSSSSSSPTVRTEHGINCQIKVADRPLEVVGEDLSEGQWKPHRLILDGDGPSRTVLENVNSGTKAIKVVADWDKKILREENRRIYDMDSASPSIEAHMAKDGQGRIKILADWHQEDGDDLVVSILTPRECWRLMGFPEWAYLRAARVSSETQLYNQAGNSIVVEVLMAIFNSMFRPPKRRVQTTLEAVA